MHTHFSVGMRLRISVGPQLKLLIAKVSIRHSVKRQGGCPSPCRNDEQRAGASRNRHSKNCISVARESKGIPAGSLTLSVAVVSNCVGYRSPSHVLGYGASRERCKTCANRVRSRVKYAKLETSASAWKAASPFACARYRTRLHRPVRGSLIMGARPLSGALARRSDLSLAESPRSQHAPRQKGARAARSRLWHAHPWGFALPWRRS